MTDSDDALLSVLEQQEDVWEFVGNRLLPRAADGDHLFAVVERGVAVGVAGLVRSQALGRSDFELVCATRSEVQQHGFAKQACQRVLAWAFGTAQLDRVIAAIDDANAGARAIAAALGMKPVPEGPRGKTVYVKERGG